MSEYGGFWWLWKDDPGHGPDVGRGRGCADASGEMAELRKWLGLDRAIAGGYLHQAR